MWVTDSDLCWETVVVTKSDIDQRITERMDVLQAMMESQQHLTDSTTVLTQIFSITKYWSEMSEEDQDFVECAKAALKEKWEWK